MSTSANHPKPLAHPYCSPLESEVACRYDAAELTSRLVALQDANAKGYFKRCDNPCVTKSSAP